MIKNHYPMQESIPCHRFRGKRDRTRGYLLSRQVGRPLHHWRHAIPVQVLEYDDELDVNESIRSLQEQNILSYRKYR